MSGRGFLAVCLPNQNCGARPPRGRAALSKWFAPANRHDEGVPHRPFGPPPHCGGEALGTTSNAVQNRPHVVFLAMTREETESDDVIARRPSGRRGNPFLGPSDCCPLPDSSVQGRRRIGAPTTMRYGISIITWRTAIIVKPLRFVRAGAASAPLHPCGRTPRNNKKGHR